MARNKYDVDEVLEDKFDLNQLKRLLAYLIPYRKRFVSVGFMMLSASAFTMLIPQFFQKVMDVCIPNRDMKGIAFYSFLTLLAAFYSAFSLRYKIKYTNQIGQQIIHDMRYDIFEHLQELPFSYYDDRPHGKIQVRVVNYVNSISDLLSNGILNTITDLCNLVFIIVFMLILNVRLTLVCLCGLPILAIVIVIIKKKQRTAWQVQSNKQSNLNAYIAESINGIRAYPILRPGRREQRYFQQLKRQLPEILDARRYVQLYDGSQHRYHFNNYNCSDLCARCQLDDQRRNRHYRRCAGRFYCLYRTFLGTDQHAGWLLQLSSDRDLLSGAYF